METMKKRITIKLISIIPFLISLFCSIDLGLNLLYSTQTQLHDGLVPCSVLHTLFNIFGDSVWTFENFFNAFEISIWTTFMLLLLNVILSLFKSND